MGKDRCVLFHNPYIVNHQIIGFQKKSELPAAKQDDAFFR